MKILIFVLLLFCSHALSAEGHIEISAASIAISPPAAGTQAAYLTIDNHSNKNISLIRVESSEFERIEIHQTEMSGDMSHMHHLPEISISAGQQIAFKPGGLHLMLHGSYRPLTPGEQITLILNFSDGSRNSSQFTAKNLTDIMPMKHENKPNDNKSNVMTSISVFIQHLLPQHLLTGLMYKLARIRWEPLKNFLINSFISVYKVDMSIAKISDVKQFPHFNAFFTRELKNSARPVDTAKNILVSPVDGAISQFGEIQNNVLIQAKGKEYKVNHLLGGDDDLAKRFENGQFITIYLSPRDYHRIHMPLSGSLNTMTYIPGKLYSVNQATTDHVEDLFAINERVVNIFDTDIGKVALVMVGAIFVGSMETVWAGEITPATHRELSQQSYDENAIELAKGQEMGRFNMGSTVILLFEPEKIQFNDGINVNQPLKMGSSIATKK